MFCKAFLSASEFQGPGSLNSSPKARKRFVPIWALGLCLCPVAFPSSSGAQVAGPESVPTPASVAPQTVVRWNGTLPEAAGLTAEIRFSVYQDQAGGLALWSEIQRVKVAPDGRYSVLLGVTRAEGLPQAMFQGGDARWIEARVVGNADAANESTPPRSPLAAVPYAFKSLDAETLAGRAASDYVTHDELKLAVAGSVEAAFQANPDVTQPTGTGTAGFVPLWTGAATLGNSVISQTGANIGIGTATPAATLDVKGTVDLRGTVKLGSGAPATVATGISSGALEFVASAFSSTTSTPVAQNFQWQATASNNNTASAGSKFQLMFGAGATPPAPTGFFIYPNGQISFAAGQKFPGMGTVTGITATSPLTQTTTGGAITIGLDVNSLITNSLNGAFALTQGNNVFSGTSNSFLYPVKFAATQTFPNSIANVLPGLGLTANTAGGAVTLAVDTTLIPQLSAGNIFTAGARFGGNVTVNTASVRVGAPYPVSLTGSGTNGIWGVLGASDSGYGVVGLTGNNDAGYFSNNSYGSPTLLASNSAIGDSTNSTVAVHGVATGASGDGVRGDATSGIGILGSASGFGGRGVSGITTASFGLAVTGASAGHDGVGVYGSSAGSAGFGLLGEATGPRDTSNNPTVGVYGSAPSGNGVFGVTGATSFTYSQTVGIGVAGVWGDTAIKGEGQPPKIALASVVGTADDASSGFFQNTSTDNPTVAAYNLGNGGKSGLPTTFVAGSPNGLCGIGAGGDLRCSGQLVALASAGGSDRKVETYAVQSPENWMEDFGSGQVENGVAMVRLDPAFAGTVSETADYHVFITPNGDSRGLYVVGKTATGFEVRESGGGKSTLGFDYRIVAKRRGYESQRLTDATDQYNTEQARASRFVSRPGVEQALSSPARQVPELQVPTSPRLVEVNPSQTARRLLAPRP